MIIDVKLLPEAFILLYLELEKHSLSSSLHQAEIIMCVMGFYVFYPVFAESEADSAVKAELGEATGLVEEDLVAVSYMGDELDLETVGDIIAIIEEKVCDYGEQISNKCE